MRRAFTLIELLVIIGIMGLMVTTSVISVRRGQGAARVKGAARDLVASIRHARSVALVTQQPAVITYSTEMVDGEPIAKIEINSTKMFQTESSGNVVVHYLQEGSDSWRPPRAVEEALEAAAAQAKADAKGGGRRAATDEKKTDDGAAPAQKEGNTLEDVLFAPVSEDVVRGMRLKVTKEGEELDETGTAQRRNKISVFSNVDYIIGKYNEKKSAAQSGEETKDEKKDATGKADSLDAPQEPVSIVWETNGRVEPHRVWIYPDGATPDQGLSVKIDRFGATKVLGSGENE